MVDGLVDCDFEDTLVMELLTEFMAELVADGELILSRALRLKFIQKFEQRKARLLPELGTSGLSLLSKYQIFWQGLNITLNLIQVSFIWYCDFFQASRLRFCSSNRLI